MSLPEFLVAMTVTTVLGVLSVGALTTVSTATRDSLATSVNLRDARLALASVERQVRSGNQPLTVSASTLSLNTCDDQTVPADLGRVRVVEFRISSGALQTRSYRASAVVGGVVTGVGWRTLVDGLGADSAFAAAGNDAVRAAVTVNGRGGRAATAETVVAPRNGALPVPVPELCP